MSNTWNWKRIRSEQGPDLKLFKVRKDWMQHPETNEVEEMTILEGNDSVNVVAYTTDEQLVLVRQYRFGIGKETLELPGGIVDDGEESGIAAARELREETGYTAQRWLYLGKSPSNPVFMDSYIHHWLAIDAQQTHAPEWDTGEAISVELLTKEAIAPYLKTGKIGHPHSVAALLRVVEFKS